MSVKQASSAAHASLDDTAGNEKAQNADQLLVSMRAPDTGSDDSVSGNQLSLPVGSAPVKEAVLFFFCAVGSTLGWTAVLSNLVFYTDMLGADSFLYLNLAVYAPLLPITSVQAAWDSYFDRQYQSLKSYSFRGHISFTTTLMCTLLLPLCSRSLPFLSMNALFLGISSAVLHGMLKQMASFVYCDCGRLPAAVTSGMQASAILILIVSIATGFGRGASMEGLNAFYFSIAGLVVCCWACFQALMNCSKDVVSSMYRRDSSMFESMGEPLMSNGDTEAQDSLEEAPTASEPFVEMSVKDLWKWTWPACISIALAVGSSMSVASYFNRVTSQYANNQSFPQLLFYTRLFADLLGRPATLFCSPKSATTLLTLSVFRLAFVPLFFLYITTNWIPKNDALATLGVFAFAFTSGYIATLSYQLAPALLRESERERNSIKQTSLVNVCFSAAVVGGLGLAFGLRGAGVE